MTSSLAKRIDRIEQKSTPRTPRFVWVHEDETPEEAIARVARETGVSLDVMNAQTNLVLVSWQREGSTDPLTVPPWKPGMDSLQSEL